MRDVMGWSGLVDGLDGLDTLSEWAELIEEDHLDAARVRRQDGSMIAHGAQRPRHKASGRIVASGLFDRLESFADLERRIAGLASTKERGDAFEVFAEAYLATQKIAQAEEVWSFEEVPIQVLRESGLDTPTDQGVDGVCRMLDGSYSAYQVKFRSGRPALRWGAELSTFMGLTDQVQQRILFTNSDDLPPLMNDRTGFHCIRGTDLDRLTKDDFVAISNWLCGSPVKFARYSPRPHQDESLDAVLGGLQDHDRITAIMACGTGKTLVALWLAERSKAKRVLVLVPSLALVRQTLHEWLQQTGWDRPRFLAVCSDPTVTKGEDTLVVHQSDLDFPVTTKPDEVRGFLRGKTASVRVVFSTYQSAHVVGEAARGLPRFDIGIFDEAHKTAGREGARFGFALEDKNVPIAKRVFMTATPRHYDIRNRDEEGDMKLVYSMDVPDIYGPVVHTLSFAEAAERDIICDYKVIISVVTSDMVNDALLRRGEVLVEGEPVMARAVANQIALQNACEKHDLKKVFSFHRSVASAKDFTGDSGSSIKAHLPGYEPLHVNGAMSTARREKLMQAFREADRAVMSNARCLTEGVDVPAVDIVAFLSPRKSKVDIVQATGRAMRKAPDKERGYLLLPLFLEIADEETIEGALDRTGFDEAWNVLQAMQEQDGVLADVIRQMREERGRTGGFDDSRLREQVEVLGPEIQLSILQQAIATSIVDRLGTSWDERFGELKAYKERFGDCNVPDKWPENRGLGVWVGTQRRLNTAGALALERKRRLDELEFEWAPRAAAWDTMFDRLQEFVRQRGHCNVSRVLDDADLAYWVKMQRVYRSKYQLDPEKIRRLESIGFSWDPRAARWDQMYSELVRYKETHGNCDVPAHSAANKRLWQWVNAQRTRRNKGALEPERVVQLETQGFEWDPNAAAWESNLEELMRFKEEHGHCAVPESTNRSLSHWIRGQRQEYRNGRLDTNRIRRIESAGLNWDPRAAAWDEMYAELETFRAKHRHSNVPAHQPAFQKLGRWLQKQRARNRKGILEPKKKTLLEDLGVDWNPPKTIISTRADVVR